MEVVSAAVLIVAKNSEVSPGKGRTYLSNGGLHAALLCDFFGESALVLLRSCLVVVSGIIECSKCCLVGWNY